MVKLALWVRLEAKPGKEAEVESFLRGGLSLVEQHRRVYEALSAPLADGTIHELRIKTKGAT